MTTERNVVDFKIHNLTEEQFQELKEAGQIDPNAIYCTPDETVANFEAVNARIDETIKTEQQHNIEINARVDETVANFEEINTEIEALKDKGGFPLLTAMWADHTLNDMSWLNADTFSWQSGDVYKAAYEHLANEVVFETGTKKYIYIKSDVSHNRFDNGLRYYRTPENDEVEPIHTCAWKAIDGVIVFTEEEAPEGDTAYTYGSATASSRIGYVTEMGEETLYSNAETETIDGITITFCRAEDGHKICPVDQEANVQMLYEATGVAWYYILDTTNKQFKLPRTKFGFTGLRDSVGKYVEAGLPNITAWFNAYSYGDGGGSGAVTSRIIVSNALASGSQSSYNFNNFSIDASSSNSTYGNSNTVQPPATQMYLYFYVGNFEKEAVEQTAGLNADMFNNKADADLSNTQFSLLKNNNGALSWNDINMSAIGMPSDKYKVLSIGSSNSEYTAPADGWFYYRDQANGTGVAEITHISTGMRICSTAPAPTWVRAVILPVKNGDVVRLSYENGGSSQTFRFIYAEGVKHLA